MSMPGGSPVGAGARVVIDSCDAAVIGGGFYGATLAARLARRLGRVVLLERGGGLLTRASLANQARIHAGYHYPRSLMTALRSAVNFTRFARDYSECVVSSFTKIYAIARESKVTADQFVAVCGEIGALVREARPEHAALLAPWLTERIFETREFAFDASALARRSAADLERAGVEVRLQTAVSHVEPSPDGRVDVVLDSGARLTAAHVFCAAYAQTNTVLRRSGLPLLPLKNECAEIALLRVPPVLERLGITIMDGPFFSVMPFPARQLHSIHHVRYSPHHGWHDLESWRDAYAHLESLSLPSRWPYMRVDASRWLPSLAQAEHVDSLFEVKTVLVQNEVDDGRPILFRPHHGLPNFSVVLGGKIDNIYDMLDALEQFDL
jgi:glycine/D-amino acid oxidase-like deaminating enzyme